MLPSYQSVKVFSLESFLLYDTLPTFMSLMGPSSAWMLSLWRSCTETEKKLLKSIHKRIQEHTCSYHNSLDVCITFNIHLVYIHNVAHYGSIIVISKNATVVRWFLPLKAGHLSSSHNASIIGFSFQPHSISISLQIRPLGTIIL